MRKASIRQNHTDFETKLNVLDQVAEKIIARDMRADLAESDVLAEGLILTLAGYWEEVVNEDFVDALNRDTSAYAEHIRIELPKNLSRGICFGLLVGERYLDFGSTGDIVGRARKVLVAANNPFVNLTNAVKTNIDHFYVLRNYLAHRSQLADRAYRVMLESDFRYSRVVRPGAFLRANGDSLGMPRLQFFLHRCREASEAIRQNAAF